MLERGGNRRRLMFIPTGAYEKGRSEREFLWTGLGMLIVAAVLFAIFVSLGLI